MLLRLGVRVHPELHLDPGVRGNQASGVPCYACGG
jgi:hypothetical protein